jgi:hypothetical protein
MTKQCSCKSHTECTTCKKTDHPNPVECYTCSKPLYDIVTYYDICDPCFGVEINQKNKPIEGFFLTFVDECGYPICFDDYESYMSIELLNGYGCQLVSYNNKIYYTYTEQANNCMPINTALWTYHYPTSAALRLSFRLCHSYGRRIRLNINVFYAQNPTPSKVLEPVVNNAVRSDINQPCVPDPCYPGYVGWMVSLRESCSDTATQAETSAYPHNIR